MWPVRKPNIQEYVPPASCARAPAHEGESRIIFSRHRAGVASFCFVCSPSLAGKFGPSPPHSCHLHPPIQPAAGAGADFHYTHSPPAAFSRGMLLLLLCVYTETIFLFHPTHVSSFIELTIVINHAFIALSHEACETFGTSFLEKTLAFFKFDNSNSLLLKNYEKQICLSLFFSTYRPLELANLGTTWERLIKLPLLIRPRERILHSVSYTYADRSGLLALSNGRISFGLHSLASLEGFLKFFKHCKSSEQQLAGLVRWW